MKDLIGSPGLSITTVASYSEPTRKGKFAHPCCISDLSTDQTPVFADSRVSIIISFYRQIQKTLQNSTHIKKSLIQGQSNIL